MRARGVNPEPAWKRCVLRAVLTTGWAAWSTAIVACPVYLVGGAAYTAGTATPVGLVADGRALIVASFSPVETDAEAVTAIVAAEPSLTVIASRATPFASVTAPGVANSAPGAEKATRVPFTGSPAAVRTVAVTSTALPGWAFAAGPWTATWYGPAACRAAASRAEAAAALLHDGSSDGSVWTRTAVASVAASPPDARR